MRVYTPYSALRTPKTFISHAVSDLMSSSSIARAIFVRDFSARYRQTFSGYISAFVPVIVTTLSFLFLRKANIVNFTSNEIDYGTFVFINTIFWELFSDSCLGPTREVQNNISSIIRLNFPRESLFLASVFNVFSNFAVKLVVVLALSFVLKINYSFALFSLIPVLLGLAGLGFCIGLLILPLSILYSDFKLVVDIGLRLLFFLSPIAYIDEYATPDNQGRVNILVYFFNSIKEIVFYGHVPTELFFIALIAAGSLLLLLIGWVVYRISVPILIERMPS